MNRVVLMGRLTRDPEPRGGSGEDAIAKMSLAIDRYTKNGKTADFIDVTVFGRQAETVQKYTGKGNRIAISGRIQTGSYEKDGRRVYTTDVIADRVEIIDFKEQNEEASPVSAFASLGEELPF